MDIEQQRNYWITSSEEDFAAAQSLLEKGHLRHCLFFAHLAIEKMLKAKVVVTTENIPPKIHDLVRLAEIAQLNPPPEISKFLYGFGLYQLEGRYPDAIPVTMDGKSTTEKLNAAKEVSEWLKAQL